MHTRLEEAIKILAEADDMDDYPEEMDVVIDFIVEELRRQNKIPDGPTDEQAEKLLDMIDARASELISSHICQSLVQQDVFEQYIDENGEFCFDLTDFGKEIAIEMKAKYEQD